MIIINKIIPQGYCSGVTNALRIVQKAMEDPSIPRPIHLLGSIIHNRFVVKDLVEKGLVIVEARDKTRLELLDEISSGTVIFSAHGVADSVYEKAKTKGLHIIDTTCGNVLVVKKNIKKYLSEGYICCYIGAKGHPECEGILGLDNSIHLIENINDIPSYKSDLKLYATNQTTLSIFETKNIYEKLKKLYKNIVIDDRICTATTIRQMAVLHQHKVDLCVVVGDKHSSNTKKLVEISQKAKINTVLVEDLNEFKNITLNNVKSISITSGASTPAYLVDEIIHYVKEKE